MNYINFLQIQIIALIFILMVLVLFSFRLKLRITRERVFMALIFSCLSCCVFEICPGVLELLTGDAYAWLIDLSRRLFLISYVAVGFSLLCYTLSEIYMVAVISGGKRMVYLLPLIVSIPLCLRLPYYSPDFMSNGPAAATALTAVIIYVLICVAYAVSGRRSISDNRRTAVYLSCVIMAGSVLSQWLFPRRQVASLGLAVMLTLMYMVLESADVYMDRLYDTFNRDACHVYLNNLCQENKRANICYVAISGFSNMNEIAGTTITSRLLRQAADFFRSQKGAKVFSLEDEAFILIFEKDEFFFDRVDSIRDRFSKAWAIDETGGTSPVEFEMKAGVVVYPAVRMVKGITSRSIMDSINYYARKILGEQTDYICIDRRQLREMEAVEHVNAELRGATEENRVEVYYQPIFPVYESRVSEVEALMRIRDSRGIFFDNKHILPAAEASGEINELGFEVFRQVCTFIRDHDLKKIGVGRIAVNLSMVQCQQRDLADKLIAIMDEYNVPASFFRFEISENTAEYMTGNLNRNMNRLTSQGALFAIDDYGNRLIDPDRVTAISKDYIKIGEDVIRQYFNGERSRQSMRVLCRMLLQLRMIVTAVGVESQKEYSELKNLGITHMQGNGFYRPMPPEELLATLEKNAAVIIGEETRFERSF
ncbi:MAG: EAL domain-containing protein [Lachnospiraceae bacterium]|nr:EAL domain-containing protein [Lachnospiraceae bacterium]